MALDTSKIARTNRWHCRIRQEAEQGGRGGHLGPITG